MAMKPGGKDSVDESGARVPDYVDCSFAGLFQDAEVNLFWSVFVHITGFGDELSGVEKMGENQLRV